MSVKLLSPTFIIAFLLPFTIIISMPIPAHAELCWEINCVGMIGWLEITPNQRRVRDEIQLNVRASGNTKTYTYDFGDNVFIKKGLPNVNDIATIGKECTPLLLEEEKIALINDTERYKGSGIILNDENMTYTYQPTESCNRAYPMAFGAEVRILGYEYAKVTNSYHSVLFALVMVTSHK